MTTLSSGVCPWCWKRHLWCEGSNATEFGISNCPNGPRFAFYLPPMRSPFSAFKSKSTSILTSWKWRSDRRRERNLCNFVKKPEKNSGLQRGLNPWPRNTGAMLYQLSHEATDVGSRSIVGSYVPVKEMSVNHIWNKTCMNCENEMKMKKWSSQWTQFMQLRKEAWKKFRTSTGFELVTSQYRCDALPT